MWLVINPKNEELTNYLRQKHGGRDKWIDNCKIKSNFIYLLSLSKTIS